MLARPPHDLKRAGTWRCVHALLRCTILRTLQRNAALYDFTAHVLSHAPMIDPAAFVACDFKSAVTWLCAAFISACSKPSNRQQGERVARRVALCTSSRHKSPRVHAAWA